jgi:hypothetical protein
MIKDLKEISERIENLCTEILNSKKVTDELIDSRCAKSGLDPELIKNIILWKK